jgi:hypothetical protein
MLRELEDALPPLPRVEPDRYVYGLERVRLGTVFAAHYRAGRTVDELAEAAGRTYSFMYRLLIDAGVEFRRRGPRLSAGRKPPLQQRAAG